MIVKRVYPDANVALHYRAFREIDWCAVVEAEEVMLVVTSVLLREVNDKKDRSRGTIQKRARDWSSWIGDLRNTKNWQIRPRVRVEVNAHEPKADLFAEHSLDPAVADDRLIACILRDRRQYPNVPVVCVTSDILLTCMADGFDIAVVCPPADQRLADEPDETELEKRELKKKIIELEKRVNPAPNLSLGFAGGSNPLSIKLHGLERPTDKDLDEELASERAGFEIARKFGLNITHRPPSPLLVDEYLEQLRKWMVEHREAAVMRAHTFDVKLVLANDGIGNANDIEIDLSFLANVAIGEKRSLPKVKERPLPPKPKEIETPLHKYLGRGFVLESGAAAAIKALQSSAFMPQRPGLSGLIVPLVSGLSSKRLVFDPKDKRHVRILVHGVNHHSSIELPRFQAWFATGCVPTGFHIEYQIYAASSPDIKKGHLDVKVEVMEGPAYLLRGGLDEPGDDEGVDGAPGFEFESTVDE
ncbi:MAG: PIN domain-containing protein [Polyangiaceae bacterium]|nr:PIN domain-containing protein [Polyangiaceae bacterium]